MNINFFKKHIIEITLITLLIISSFACVYGFSKYRGNSSGFQQKNFQMNNIRRNTGERKNVSPNMSNMKFQNNSRYSPVLTLYFSIFLAFSILIYNLRKYRIKSSTKNNLIILLLFCTGFIARLALSTTMEGYSGDIRLFGQWASNASRDLLNFYQNTRSSDYPPMYIYVLFLIGKLQNLNVLNQYSTVLLKLPSILADMCTAYLILKVGKKYMPFWTALFLSSFYIFNPAVFIDSVLWGQVDSFFTLLIALSVFLIFNGKTVLSTIFLHWQYL